MTTQSRAKVCARPEANVMPANTRIATTTTPSTDNFSRSRGNAAAPINAPNPKQPSNTPYPRAPKGRAIIGISASKEAAATLNVPVRKSTDFASELSRT